jgi:CheY-like chemotaxis protein
LGTRIKIFWPATEEKKLPDETQVLTRAALLGKESILVVDDVQDQRDIARRMLEKLGYAVTTVSSGEEALVHLKTHTADLVVLDMIMEPGIDGLETYRQMLKIRPGQRAIIASGYSESERVKLARKLGTGAYLKKPYLIEEIGKAVRTELTR